jgi:hypothetical protein
VGGKGGGQTQLASLITFTAGGCDGGRGGGREQIRPCTRCSLHAFSLTLCLSFSYLHSAVEASFDTKKACGKPYTLFKMVFVWSKKMFIIAVIDSYKSF